MNVGRCPSVALYRVALYQYLSNRRRPRESLVLVVVLVLVIGNRAVEDEDQKEDDDDWVAAPLRCAVSRICNIENLRYDPPLVAR